MTKPHLWLCWSITWFVKWLRCFSSHHLHVFVLGPTCPLLRLVLNWWILDFLTIHLVHLLWRLRRHPVSSFFNQWQSRDSLLRAWPRHTHTHTYILVHMSAGVNVSQLTLMLVPTLFVCFSRLFFIHSNHSRSHHLLLIHCCASVTQFHSILFTLFLALDDWLDWLQFTEVINPHHSYSQPRKLIVKSE